MLTKYFFRVHTRLKDRYVAVLLFSERRVLFESVLCFSLDWRFRHRSASKFCSSWYRTQSESSSKRKSNYVSERMRLIVTATITLSRPFRKGVVLCYQDRALKIAHVSENVATLNVYLFERQLKLTANCVGSQLVTILAMSNTKAGYSMLIA